MFLRLRFKFNIPLLPYVKYVQTKKCHSIFGLQDLLRQDKLENFSIKPVLSAESEKVVEIVKRHYLTEHVLVQARDMHLNDDRALDEYLISLLRQGNSLFAKTEDNQVAGVCVNFASSLVHVKDLRNYAFYRQDPNTKEFLYFIAKLQETPNLWEVFKQPKIFEIKMLTVIPEYRRQGLAVMLAEKSKEQAFDQGYKVVRMDCINLYDYKVAERCMMNCIVRFPLHKLRGANAPYIKRSSEFNRFVRVYVDARIHGEKPECIRYKQRQADLENMIE